MSNQKQVWAAERASNVHSLQFVVDYATRKGCLMVVDGPDDLAQQVAEKLNACEGQQLHHVSVATEHYEACLQWERLMMQLVGEDGPGAVEEAIKLLKLKLQAHQEQDKEIRAAINADPNESTIDEVGRILNSRYKLYLSLKELFAFCEFVIRGGSKNLYPMSKQMDQSKTVIEAFEKWRGENEGNS